MGLVTDNTCEIDYVYYSTEKFACIKMVEYFSKLAVNAEFVHGMPCFDDM